MCGENYGNSREAARRDAEEKCWRAQREERKRQREEQRRLEENLMKYALALQKQASWRGKHNRPK